jgi:flagellar FliJ protein
MKHGDSLKTVARLAGNDEREMACRMSECRVKMEMDEQQLQSLQQYRGQYLDAFHEAGADCLHAAQLQDYRVFLGRLDQAIGQQQQVLQQSRQAFEDLHLQWLKLHGESKALQKLIANRQRRNMQEQARSEQKELDERAGWAFHNHGMT